MTDADVPVKDLTQYSTLDETHAFESETCDNFNSHETILPNDDVLKEDISPKMSPAHEFAKSLMYLTPQKYISHSGMEDFIEVVSAFNKQKLVKTLTHNLSGYKANLANFDEISVCLFAPNTYWISRDALFGAGSTIAGLYGWAALKCDQYI